MYHSNSLWFVTAIFVSWQNIHTMQFTIFTILSVQFSDIEYILIIVQPSSPSISRTFSSFQPKTLYPLNSDFSFLLPQWLTSMILLCLSKFDLWRYFI